MALICCVLALPGQAQQPYWQQQADFSINVSLNEATNTLKGFETINYTNRSPDTLNFIWFHLWPNGYKNDRTAFSEQLLKNGRTDFYFSAPKDKGYINQLNFMVDNIAAVIEPSADIDVVKLVLPKPLLPKATVVISTPFNVQLPAYVSRSGHTNGDYQVTQWYPKPAVYDALGWHPMPYLDQGEFYSEFGKFDVQITVPANYVVAATGILQPETQGEALGVSQKAGALKTVHYIQDKVHDFAWFASENYFEDRDTLRLPSGKVVEVASYYKKGSKGWNKTLGYLKNGLRFYSNALGDYPYETATIVQGPDNVTSGGMEYPTITLITTADTGRALDATIVHEAGHNWFYGALASNERTHPWMDEGMNTFYQKQYEAGKYGAKSALYQAVSGLAGKVPNNEVALFLHSLQKLEKDAPIDQPSTAFSENNYQLSVYEKASAWMQQLKDTLGADVFNTAMKDYYAQWQFKHPYPADFKRSIESSTKKDLTVLFARLYKTDRLKKPLYKKQLKLSGLFNLRETDKYNYINIAPVIGFNRNDKVMIGGMVHNYQLPLNRLNFIAGAMYATGSGKVNSFSRVSYNVTHRLYDVEVALSHLNVSKSAFTFNNNTIYPRVARLVPSVKLTLYKPDPGYDKRLTLAFKSFILGENNLDFRTVITGSDTTDEVGLKKNNSLINRLAIGYSDSRTLYPHSVALVTDQGKNFIRAGLTAKAFFNYADNKTGLDIRLFAGKFFYLGSKTITNQIAVDRYLFNMTGPKGNEDYTYSDYFIGRNDFTGYASQQIMERDGFFKVRTDLLSNKIGKTDNWLISMNLVTDIPASLNPLQVLPVKIPLKLFADVGTYAGAWEVNAGTGRFLYDAGIQVAILNSFINIYIPLIYSKVYSNYFKSTITEKRFLKNISFSIDLQKLDLKRVIPGSPF